MLAKLTRFARRYRLSRQAARYAARRGIPGLAFNRYGVSVGRRLVTRGWVRGVDYLLCPVNCVRYFEFDFAQRFLPARPPEALDLSSPRLFTLHTAERSPHSSILMMNPDPLDLGQTRQILEKLRIKNVSLSHDRVSALASASRQFDSIWAISVVEHIAGECSDTEAAQLLFAALKPKGVLVLTVPVDRVFREEYREVDSYRTESPKRGGKHFFQYVYDQAALYRRLIDPLGVKPAAIQWFGERVPGHYAEYEKRWLAQGPDCLVHDAREVADHYTQFARWEEMPGFGICALAIVR